MHRETEQLSLFVNDSCKNTSTVCEVTYSQHLTQKGSNNTMRKNICFFYCSLFLTKYQTDRLNNSSRHLRFA